MLTNVKWAPACVSRTVQTLWAHIHAPAMLDTPWMLTDSAAPVSKNAGQGAAKIIPFHTHI